MIPPVVAITAALAVGVSLGVRLAPGGWILLAAGALGLVAAGRSRRRDRQGRGRLLLAALAVGAVWGGTGRLARSRRCADQWPAGRQAAIVRVHDAPGSSGLTDATVLSHPFGCGGVIRVRMDSGVVAAGQTVVAAGVVRRNGIFRIDHLHRLPRVRPIRFRIRATIRNRIDRLYGRDAPIVEALVLGRRHDLDPDLRHRFTSAGLAHLLAISGLHVGLLAAWILLVALRLLPPRAAWAAAGIVLWGYVLLIGAPPSSVRAATFVSVALVARWRGRNPPAGATLAVAALLMLVVDPEAVVAVGAWLSVAAVWGTWAGGRLLERGGPRLLASPAFRRGRGALRLLASSAGATVLTAPITAWTFGSVAPVGILTNLAAIPLAGLAVPGVFLSLLLGPIVATGADVALRGIDGVARLGAEVPGGHVLGEPHSGFAIVVSAVVLVLGWTAWRFPRWSVAGRRALLVAVVGVWMGPAVRHWPGSARNELRISVLDVGQGDAIVVRTPHGHWVLVDGGPRTPSGDAGRRVVLPWLRRRGVDRLDAVIVSHGDADHLGGVPSILPAMTPRWVLEPGQPLGSDLYADFLGEVDAGGARWWPARAGDSLLLDSVVIAVLHPSAEWFAHELRPNENSIVVRVSYGTFDALLTGDAGWPVESLLVDRVRPVEVLKVGHHGSAGGTSSAWLDAVHPAAAVLSVGAGNRYGHPAPSVLRRIEDRHIPIYRTDRGGTVTIRTNGDYFVIEQGRIRDRWEGSPWPPENSSRLNVSSSTRNGSTRKPPGN